LLGCELRVLSDSFLLKTMGIRFIRAGLISLC
jgi:hypothetical protein